MSVALWSKTNHRPIRSEMKLVFQLETINRHVETCHFQDKPGLECMLYVGNGRSLQNRESLTIQAQITKEGKDVEIVITLLK